MNLNPAIVAFILTCGTAIALVLRRTDSMKQKRMQGIEDFLLGSKSLDRGAVINLLLSSSFGVNALFYAIWLGYSVGVWGLAIQGAWAISFLLLTPYTNKIRSANSLHDFLGKRFGAATQMFAAVCSLTGLMYLIGWEVAISENSFKIYFQSSIDSSKSASLLIGGIIIGTLTYTILGGLRGNSIVDKLLNALKVIFIGFLTALMLSRSFWVGSNNLTAAIFPSFRTMAENLGLWGLITNIVFNISWQFVDNSSWQSIIAGGERKNMDTVRSLRLSSLTIFLTVGLMGTLIGISLVGSPGLGQDNILQQAINLFPGYGALLAFGMFVVIISCTMSLLDGLFLASSLTLLTDILKLNKGGTLIRISHNPKRRLFLIRISLIVVALIAVYGVRMIFQLTGTSLFDFVYIVIITQLALFGPVIIGLTTDRANNGTLWISIPIALVVGFASVYLGIDKGAKFLVDGAGTLTLLASTATAFLLTKEQAL